MATLELAIDATKAQQGAQVAQQAFTQVQKAAEGAARSIQVSNQAVSSAFQATGGTVQVAGGITATAKALSDLNIAAASSNAARLLLEIGKTAQDFKEVAAGVQQVTTSYDIYGTKITTVTQATSRFGAVFATLNGIIKANPLLAAATAISAIGTALSLFSSKTDEATESYKKFGDALRELRIDAETAAYLGIAGAGAGSQAQRLIEASRTARQTGQGINIREFQGTELDRRAAEIAQRQLAGTYQGGLLAEFQATGGTTRFGGARGERQIFTPGLPDIQLTQQQTQELLRELYRETSKQLDAEKASAAAADDAAKARRQIADQLEQQVVQFGGERPQPGILGGIEPRAYEAPYYLQRPTVAPGTYQFGAGAPVQTQMPQVGFPTGGYATAGYQYSGGRLRPEYQVEPGQAPPLLARPDRITMTDTRAPTMAMQGFENAVFMAVEIAKYKKQEEEAARRVAENFQRAADYAGQVGGSLGSAFADVLMKTTTLRQAFASIVASFARQGLADIGASIFRGAVSGLTPTQAGANVGINNQAAS